MLCGDEGSILPNYLCGDGYANGGGGLVLVEPLFKEVKVSPS